MQNLYIQNDLIRGRGFDPRRLHHTNGLITGLRKRSKPSNWSYLVNISTVYGSIKGNISALVKFIPIQNNTYRAHLREMLVRAPNTSAN